ncbi:MAG TPA: GFA family protein [Verrucomicrobiae bacterium]|jgi:hypothetical protein|nr:GFA family protein [Verrucomicrobiae bacterium]
MAMKTYHGSCACGKVRYEAAFDLSEGTFKCNCSICTKARLWGKSVKTDSFKLLSGKEDLSVWGDNILHHFCRHCGIKVFGKPKAGGDMMVVMLGTLDDLDPKEWAAAPVRYFDGRNDNFKTEPEFKAHL